MTKKIAIFASGTGTNFVALVQQLQHWRSDVSIELLIYDRKQAAVHQRSQELGVPSVYVNFTKYADKSQAETAMLQALKQRHIDLILLAGYMRIVGPTLLNAYQGHILNIHPALLPAFPGAHGIEDAFKAGVKVTGVTIHFIDAGVDSGPIIAQETVRIDPTDTLATLENRIHQIEHQLYPRVVKELITEGVV
ncbi:phosphoribosylglycinamide formyltransferase [Agrilactobacillus fermenti]|uniref:phosphoribosylglycinamide formyltransferase n=1 Tax=Agrilactobacillus fermenti TaxID=2586909 RepID=UPI001E2D9245|nr:phosphoribosylglycinamide formyltransferase [Agrilactobacillus fermenti]MCD2255896.1 phosphoribosylglycinamide formyltransferase [Agrilactobacillus fermenti]